MKLEALIFDLDGTMADTEETHRRAFNEAFRTLELGWEWSPHRYAVMLAVSGGKLRLQSFIETLEVDAKEAARLRALVPLIHDTKTRIYHELVSAGGAPLRPGVARLLREARAEGLRVVVVSTTASGNAYALLRAQLGSEGMGLIAAVVTAEMVRRPKPRPDLYLHALAVLRTLAERCIAIEDSANGVRAARAAGIAVLATPSQWTAKQDFEGADHVCASLEEPARIGVAELRSVHAAALARPARA